MYESTPQHIIDEEAVPGPVAAWMEHSSAHFSGSSSDSDASGFSHITARRVKRIVRRHTRRSRSYGSKEIREITCNTDLNSRRSLSTVGISPADREPYPSICVTDASKSGIFDDQNSTTIQTRQISICEDEKRPTRDHSRKRHKKSRKRSTATNPDDAISVTGEPKRAIEETKILEPPDSAPAVVEQTKDAGEGNLVLKHPYLRLITFRPNIPKSLSQNVFTQPYPDRAATCNESAPYARPPCKCRRTNSLPDRLNLPQTFNPRNRLNETLAPNNLNGDGGISHEDSETIDKISRTTAVFLLFISTALVATCAEFMLDSIHDVVQSDSGLSEAFIGLIILPIVGNAAEHVTAVTVAAKNKMDLAIGVAIGSSIQIGKNAI